MTDPTKQAQAPPSARLNVLDFIDLLRSRYKRAGIQFDMIEVARAMDSAKEMPGAICHVAGSPASVCHEDGRTRVYVDLGTWEPATGRIG